MSKDEEAMIPQEGSPPSTWTTQAPTAPGLYWYRRSVALKPHIVEVELEGGTLKVDDQFIDYCRGEVTTIEGQWAGPLPPTK